MQAQVQGIEGNDISGWPNWSPTNVEDELQWFTVSIGSADSDSTDLFQVAVATARGIDKRRLKEKFSGLVVDEFTPVRVEQAIRDYVAGTHAATWDGVARKLGRVMQWEYDGYR